MAKTLSIIILLLVLSGCATKERIVYVPTQQIEPPLITRPELDTDYLKPGMDASEVISAYRLTITKLMAWGLSLEQALSVYAKPKGQ